MASIATEEVVGLKPKIYWIRVSIKKQKAWIKMLLLKCQHKYKDILSNKNCLRHSINRIQSKNHRIKTYEINKISLSCFDDKVYILDKGIDVFALRA